MVLTAPTRVIVTSIHITVIAIAIAIAITGTTISITTRGIAPVETCH